MNKTNPISEKIKDQAEFVQYLRERIFSRLPKDLEESAKTHGAILRKRIIKSAENILLMFFVYALSNISERVLAALAGATIETDMSDQAWQKKMLKCSNWLIHLLNMCLPIKPPRQIQATFKGRDIKLVDSSCVKQEGTDGETIRIHTCYSLSAGKTDEVSVTDNKTAESFKPFSISESSIYTGDCGYGKGKNLDEVVSQKADVILRVTPNHLSLASDPKGKKKIDMAEKLGATDQNVVDIPCYVHTENNKYVKARIIASRLPEDKALEAIERKKRNAQKKQTKAIKDETLIYAQWVIIMTSLRQEEYSATDILGLYRLRWQIELLFKRIKQAFNVTKIRAASIKHSKVLVLLWLIAWVIIEGETVAWEIALIAKQENMSLYSPWTATRFAFEMFKADIYCLVRLTLDENKLLVIHKRLRNHKSRRKNQFANFCFSSLFTNTSEA